METNEILISIVDKLALEEAGFSKVVYNPAEFSLYREKEEKIDILSIVFTSYNELHFSGCGASIHFKQVEEILQPIVNKYDPHPALVYATLVIDDINRMKNMVKVKENYNLAINNEASIKTLANDLRQDILEHLEPYWQKFDRLQSVNDEIITKVPQMELGNFIPGLYMPYKKLIIMKLCNNMGYNVFKEWLYGLNEEDYKNNPKDFEKEYLFSKELESFLLTL